MSNEFQGGNAAPGMYIVPFASPSSSLPAKLMMSPPGPPSSTPPAVTAPEHATGLKCPSDICAADGNLSSSSASSVNICEDGEDNDGDGRSDATDDDCDSEYNLEEGTSSSTASICEDGEDNDGDGRSDATDDDCDSEYNLEEGTSSSTASICGDGEDNDGDGSIDSTDVDCDAGSDSGAQIQAISNRTGKLTK